MHGQLGQAKEQSGGAAEPAGPQREQALADAAEQPRLGHPHLHVDPERFSHARASTEPAAAVPSTGRATSRGWAMPRWLRRCARLGGGLLAILLPVVLLAAGLLYGRLLYGPISVSFLADPIERVLNEEMPGIQFGIEDAILQLTPQGGIEFRLTSVRVTEDTGSLVALASRASVQPSWRALRLGRIAPARIDLLQPRVVLFAPDRPSYMLGYGRDLQGRTLNMPAAAPGADAPAGRGHKTGAGVETSPTSSVQSVTIMRDRIDAARRVAEIAGELRRRKGAAAYLETLGLKDASLIVSDDRQQTVLQLPSLELSLRHRSHRSVIAGSGTMAGAGAPFRYRFRMEDSERQDRLTFKVDVEGLVPRSLALGQSGLNLLEGVDLPLAGHGEIMLSRQGDILGGTFDVSLEAGRLHLPWLGKVPLELAGGALKASYEGTTRRLVVAPSTLRWRTSHATLKGEVAPAQQVEDGPEGWRFEFEGVDGVLAAEDLGAPPLPLSGLVMRGTAFPSSGYLEVAEFEMTAGEARLGMVGTIAASGSQRVARLDGRIGPMSLNALKVMWPQALAPQTRSWVASHVVTGRLRGGGFSLANERPVGAGPGDSPSRRALTLSLDAEDIALEYLKGMPPLEAQEAHLLVEGTSATLRIPGGLIKLPPGQPLEAQAITFVVSDVDRERPHARLEARIMGPASGLADALARPPLNLARSTYLEGAKFEGKLDARFNAAFPLYSGLSMQDVQILEGKASVIEGHAQKIMGRYSISGASLRAEVRENAIDVTGEMLLNGVLAKLGWRQPLLTSPEGASPSSSQGLRLRATLGNSERAQLGIQLGELVNGDVDVEVNLRPGEESEKGVRVAADLTGAEIQLSDLSWTKPPGQRAELRFDVAKGRDDNVVLQNFRLDGDTIGVNGWVALGADNRPVEYLFTDFSLNTVSSMTVRGTLRADRVWEIKANGARFDARSIFSGFLNVGAGGNATKAASSSTTGMDLDARLETVSGVPDVYVPTNPDPRLRSVHLRLSSRNNQVREIEFSGRHDNGRLLSASMKTAGGGPRILTVDTEDTGEALKLIGIYRSMRGGEGRLELNLDGSGATERRGTMRVRRFRVIGDPVVSDMASAYSDGGQPAIKQGTRQQHVVREQIEFDRLRATFATGNGQLVIEDMEVVGPIMGATLRGKLDYRTERVHLGGTYTPLSGLNRALSGVPLFGEVLTGPRREGIVAMTFAIQGPMSNPQFIPNPLSLMTPGFLREIFQMAPNNPTVTPGRHPSQIRKAPQPRTTASPPATGPSAAPRGAPSASSSTKGQPKARARAKAVSPEITDGWAATTDPRAGSRARN